MEKNWFNLIWFSGIPFPTLSLSSSRTSTVYVCGISFEGIRPIAYFFCSFLPFSLIFFHQTHTHETNQQKRITKDTFIHTITVFLVEYHFILFFLCMFFLLYLCVFLGQWFDVHLSLPLSRSGSSRVCFCAGGFTTSLHVHIHIITIIILYLLCVFYFFLSPWLPFESDFVGIIICNI